MAGGIAGKRKGPRGFKTTTRPKTKLLGEEQREHAETFGEGHTDDGLHEDLGRGAGIAADGFGGFGADHTDADGGAEKTESGGEVAVDFSEDGGHVVDVFWLRLPPCARCGTLPAVK